MLSRINQWIFPHICCLCQHYTTTKRDLCTTCESTLPRLSDRCYRCGLPLEAHYPGTESIVCIECKQSPPPFDRLCAVFNYEPPVTQLTTGLKFGKQLAYGRLLGELFAEAVPTWYKSQPFPEAIIPVPLHPKRYLKRGFNQSVELLAPLLKQVSKQVSGTHRCLTTSAIPMLLDVCVRTKKTIPQSELDEESRKRNLKNAFQLVKPIPYEHIAIMDDVVTTGSTVRALSELFKNAGVQQIDIWCICRT